MRGFANIFLLIMIDQTWFQINFPKSRNKNWTAGSTLEHSYFWRLTKRMVHKLYWPMAASSRRPASCHLNVTKSQSEPRTKFPRMRVSTELRTKIRAENASSLKAPSLLVQLQCALWKKPSGSPPACATNFTRKSKHAHLWPTITDGSAAGCTQQLLRWIMFG